MASHLQGILHLLFEDSNVGSPGSLTEAQAILLHWGRFQLFAWETWDDPKAIGFEVATAVVRVCFCYVFRGKY